ncbi:hypothetical protein [Deinococcus pimensis]|uniref:hypothetical protein n=1 Tax=Deinococcus pimensis TaxID=309888 RepID=UPI00048010C0|nr:hypothetical protein [Deinococcus pimensis]
MTSRAIHPTQLADTFRAFLTRRDLSLDAITPSAAFEALLDFTRHMSVELGGSPEAQDLLHVEAGPRVLYFERVLNVTVNVLYPDEDDEVMTELYALHLKFDGDALNALPAMDVQAVTAVRTSSLWSEDFGTLDAFAQAVRAHPVMRRAEQASPMTLQLVQGELG